MRNIIGIIPSRYGSTRFPGKPLHLIAGKPLVQHVVERCKLAGALSEVIVATDDERIAAVTRPFCKTVMTRSDHPSGTDRIAEVAARLSPDAVINIQGDEPLIDPKVIDSVANALDEFPMTTAAVRIKSTQVLTNPNAVKVVMAPNGRALYFSRSPIPYFRDNAGQVSNEILVKHAFFHHMGIYGYRADTLTKIVKLPVSKLESLECLEQLRALEAGIDIGVIQSDSPAIGVDTPEDVAQIESLLKNL